MTRTTFHVALMLVAITFLGCIPPENPPSNNTAAGNEGGDNSEQAKKVTTQLKSWEEVQTWIASQKGKIVVVDVWSTACGECIKEFPNFVTFADKYDGKVAAASLNIDYYGSKKETAESGVPRIEKRLNQLKAANIINFVSTTPDGDIMVEVDAAAIPVSLVYDAEGNLAKSFNNDAGEYGEDGFKYAEHISEFVDSLLAAAK